MNVLGTMIQANGVTKLNEPVNIFEEETFNEIKDGKGVNSKKTKASRVDTIAHTTKKEITEKYDADPIFYEKFSKLIQKAIDDFRAKRISDLEYLSTISQYREEVVQKHRDNVPTALETNGEALSYYEMARYLIAENSPGLMVCEEASVYIAEATQESLKDYWKVNFWQDINAQNHVRNEIDDHLFDKVCGELGVNLPENQMDTLIENLMKIAKSRTDC